jgi:hypothetical protein
MQRCSTRVVSNGCGLSMWLPLGMCLLVAVYPWRIPAHATGTRGLCKLARVYMLPGKGVRGMRMLTYYLFLERGVHSRSLSSECEMLAAGFKRRRELGAWDRSNHHNVIWTIPFSASASASAAGVARV